MAGLAIIADRIEKTTKAGSVQAVQDQRSDDEPKEEIDRDQSEDLAGPERLDDRWDARRARHHALAVDDHHAAGHEARAERHHERLDPQERHADAVDDSDNDAEGEGDADCDTGAGRRVGGEKIGRAGRHASDREIDAPRQHNQRLAGAYDRQRRGEHENVGGPERRHRPGTYGFNAEHEKRQQQDQCENRTSAEECEEGAHFRSCKYAKNPATITTSTISVPWMT